MKNMSYAAQRIDTRPFRQVIKMPTDKQVEYATKISDVLEIPLPEEYTLEAYQRYIGMYSKTYKENKYFK